MNKQKLPTPRSVDLNCKACLADLYEERAKARLRKKGLTLARKVGLALLERLVYGV